MAYNLSFCPAHTHISMLNASAPLLCAGRPSLIGPYDIQWGILLLGLWHSNTTLHSPGLEYWNPAVPADTCSQLT